MRVGIIGLGNFGRFVAGVLTNLKNLEVLAYDTSHAAAPKGVKKVTLSEVATADAIVLCVPLSSYDRVLPKLWPHLWAESLVVDICSVKVEAEKRLRQHLPGHENILITHPMFGPQSAANGLEGHTLVVTGAEGRRAKRAVSYCQNKLGLKIARMTSEEHDKAMADVHALTFFVARGLARTKLAASPFQAPSFQMLLDLVAFDKAHTDDLFRTIELGNPYAKQSRNRLMKALEELNDKLGKETV